jgi:hypothetical protein
MQLVTSMASLQGVFAAGREQCGTHEARRLVMFALVFVRCERQLSASNKPMLIPSRRLSDVPSKAVLDD